MTVVLRYGRGLRAGDGYAACWRSARKKQDRRTCDADPSAAHAKKLTREILILETVRSREESTEAQRRRDHRENNSDVFSSLRSLRLSAASAFTFSRFGQSARRPVVIRSPCRYLLPPYGFGSWNRRPAQRRQEHDLQRPHRRRGAGGELSLRHHRAQRRRRRRARRSAATSSTSSSKPKKSSPPRSAWSISPASSAGPARAKAWAINSSRTSARSTPFSTSSAALRAATSSTSKARVDPIRDIDTIDTELALADLETVSSSLDKAERLARGGDKEAIAARGDSQADATTHLNEGKPVRALGIQRPTNSKLIKSLGLITAKKVLYVANVDEADLHGKGPLVQKVRAARRGGRRHRRARLRQARSRTCRACPGRSQRDALRAWA